MFQFYCRQKKLYPDINSNDCKFSLSVHTESFYDCAHIGQGSKGGAKHGVQQSTNNGGFPNIYFLQIFFRIISFQEEKGVK